MQNVGQILGRKTLGSWVPTTYNSFVRQTLAISSYLLLFTFFILSEINKAELLNFQHQNNIRQSE